MGNLSLFEIESQYRLLADTLIEAGGELTDGMETALQINKTDLETKARSYGYVVLDLESEVEQIEAQIKRLSAMKSARNKTIDRLKETVSNAMQLFEISEVKTATLKLNFRKSESVEVDNLDLLDATYKVEKVSITANKVKIKEDIKAGINVMGAVLQVNQNLQIK
jgi:hypothetical protein